MGDRQKTFDMPEIIFVSSFLPPCNMERIRFLSKGAISNANSNFQLSILDGLLLNDSNTYVINAPNIGAFPFKYRRCVYVGGLFDYHGAPVRDCTFFNLIYFKHAFRKAIVKRELRKKLSRNEKPPIIVVYDLDPSYIKSILELRAEGCDFIAVNVVPDLPGMTGRVNHWAYRFLGGIGRRQADWAQMDGYVLLSKYMAAPLNIENKPYMLMEGIYSSEQSGMEPSLCFEELKTHKYILYTGALDKRNGVIHLLNAFKDVRQEDVKLVLCGEGEAREAVETEALQDSRIVYLGQVDHKVAIELQKSATLLINPRLPSENFAKYSFPSKTMEYLASGTPLLMYRLASLPTTYEEHLFLPIDETVQSLAQLMSELLEMDPQILKAKGEKAKQFILVNKTAKHQVERLIEFSNNIYLEKYEHPH